MTRATTYAVSAQIDGTQLCVSNSTCNSTSCGGYPAALLTPAASCIQDANVTVGAASASTSLLIGSGAVKDATIVANTKVNLVVVPLDAHGNVITKDSSAYAVNVTRVADNSAVKSMDAMTYDSTANDGTHTYEYQLATSGVYTVGVTQTDPDGNAFHVVGTNGAFNVTIVAGAPHLDSTAVTVPGSSVSAGADATVDVTLKDSNGNTVEVDRTDDLVVVMRPSLESNRKFASTDDSSASGTGGAVRISWDSVAKKHVVKFNIPIAETYTVAVYVAGRRIGGSDAAKTFTIVANDPDARTTTATGVGLQTASAGTEARFSIVASDRYGNVLTAAAASTPTVEVAVTARGGDGACGTVSLVTPAPAVTWNSNMNRYDVAYTPLVSGPSSVRVKLGTGDSVRDSPFAGVVTPGTAHAGMSTVTGSGVHGAVVNGAGKVTIHARDANGGDKTTGGDPFRAYVVDANGALASPTVTITDNDDGTYSAAWTPSVAGTSYELNVILKGGAVGQSPYGGVKAVASLGSATPAKFEAVGHGLTRAVAGERATFTIEATDADGIGLGTGGRDFTVTLAWTPSGGSQQTKTLTEKNAGDANADDTDTVLDNGDGTYTVTYTPTAAVTHALDVKDGGSTAIGGTWPASVTVHPGSTDVTKSIVDTSNTLPATSTAGTALTVRVLARDGNDNAKCYDDDGDGLDEFVPSLSIDGVVSVDEVPVTITQNKAGGYYDFTFTPTKVGTYAFDVSLGNVQIGTSPLASTVVSEGAMNAGASTVDGSALFGGLSGVKHYARVVARDAHGNPITSGLVDGDCAVALTNEDDSVTDANATAECDYVSNGVFNVTLRSFTAGEYTLAVNLSGTAGAGDAAIGGTNASDSPYTKVSFAPGPPVASTSTLADLSKDLAAVAGELTTFTLTARDEFGSARTVGGDVVSAQLVLDTVTVHAAVTDNADGTYALEFEPPVTGTNQTLEVKIGTSHVKNSPFNLTVTSAVTDASATYVEQAQVDSYVQCGFADVICGVAGETNSFTIKPLNVHGVAQDVNLVDDTFDVAITPCGNSFGSLGTDGATECGVSTAVKVVNEGGYEVKWRADRIQYDVDGVVSPYTLSVRLGGTHIAGSPFTLVISPARAVATKTLVYHTNSGVMGYDPTRSMRDNTFVAGEPQRLVVHTRDAFSNDAGYDGYAAPQVTVTARLNGTDGHIDQNRGEEVVVRVTNMLDGLYRLSFTPTKAGPYTLWVTVDGTVVGDDAVALPVVVEPAALSPPHFAVWGPGITEPSIVSQPNYFRVQVRDRFHNNVVHDGSLIVPVQRNCAAYYQHYSEIANCKGFEIGVELDVRVGEIFDGTSNIVPAEEVTVLFDPYAPDMSQHGTLAGSNTILNATNNHTNGTYLVNYTVGKIGFVLATVDVERVVEAKDPLDGRTLWYSENYVVTDSPHPAPAVRGLMSSGSMSGFGTEDGAAARVELPVIITPRDSRGNPAALEPGDAARYAISVSPAHRAEVTTQPATDGMNNLVASWTGKLPGDVAVSVKLDGVDIPGSPKTVNILANPLYMNINPLLSRAVGPALTGSYAGQKTRYLVELVTDSGAGFPASADYEWSGADPCVVGSAARGFVQVKLDNEVLGTGPAGDASILDNCNGTYVVSLTQTKAGTRLFQTLIGPEAENPNFRAGVPRGIGPVVSASGFVDAGLVDVVVYSGPTATATVEWLGHARVGNGYVGDKIEVSITPEDAYGNKIDYHVFPRDALGVSVDINAVGTDAFTLTRRPDSSRPGPTTYYFHGEYTPTEAGKYTFTVHFDAQDGAYTAVGEPQTMDIAASTASVDTSVVSGDGVAKAMTGVLSWFRVELFDRRGNAAGRGEYIAPSDLGIYPNHPLPGISTKPTIVEARLVPFGKEYGDTSRPQNEERLRAIFDELDKDNSGKLNADELANGINMLSGLPLDELRNLVSIAGHSLSMSSDGTRMAIGAYLNDGGGTDAGHVRVYSESGGTWSQLGGDIDGESAGDQFGRSVSMSADGARVAIGARYNDGAGADAGHVRVYSYNVTWSQVGADIDGDAAGDWSGWDVSMSSDGARVAVSDAGYVRVYSDNNGTWSQVGADIDGKAAGDWSLWDVSMSSDGTHVAIVDGGYVRVYNESNGTWSQVGDDIDSEPPGEWYMSGQYVSISQDGKRVASTAYLTYWNDSSTDYINVRVSEYNETVFNLTGNDETGAWIRVGADVYVAGSNDDSGQPTSMSSDGTRLVIGANRNNAIFAGTATLYDENDGNWTEVGTLNPNLGSDPAGDQSGWAVSMSPDGTRVAIGAHLNKDAGHVRVFEFDDAKTREDSNGPAGWNMVGATVEGENAGDTETRTVDTETIRKVLFPQMDTDDGGDVSEAEFIAWHGVHRLEETSTVQATIEYDYEHDVYIGSYNATESGRSSLVVLLYGQVITMATDYLGTDVTVGDATTAACTAAGSILGAGAVPAVAGRATSVTVHARDVFGNGLSSGGSVFDLLARPAIKTGSGVDDDATQWTVDDTKSVYVAPPELLDRGDGTYLSTFTPTVSGTYLAFITRGGVAILGSPYLFTVVPGMISAARSTLECIDGEESVCPLESDVAVVGVEAKFHVVARDAHGNVNTRPADTRPIDGDTFYYSAVGAGNYAKWRVANEVGTDNPGRYLATLNTTVSGSMAIRVTLGRYARVARGDVHRARAGVPRGLRGHLGLVP